MSDLEEARRRIHAAYNPDAFEMCGESTTKLLSDYLRDAGSSPTPAMQWHSPEQLVKEARRIGLRIESASDEAFDGEHVARCFEELAGAFLAANNRLHSPHYMGHQVPASIPLAGLFDALGSVTNQPMAIYEMGPFATACEKVVTERLAEYLGWRPGDFAAIGTHGGSLANLTALLTARNVKYPTSWEDGIAAAAETTVPAVVCGQDSHYCNIRAAAVIGLGANQVLKAPLDQKRRMCPNRLVETLDRARADGLDVFAVIASACSTPIGAFDPLDEIAEIASERGLWLHVDGAHGASAVISRRHRHLVKGIGRADSLTWDAHKMLFMPALCTYVFYQRKQDSYQTFKQNAPYLLDPAAPELAEYDSAVRTVECTKRAMSTGLWGVWSIFGSQLFENLIDVTFDLGQQFYGLLADAHDFEPLHVPQCNIVVFRHHPSRLRDAPAEKVSQFQERLRRRIVESGDFYITSTRLDGMMALRVTLINPLSQTTHLTALLDSLRRHGKHIEVG